MTSFVKGTKIAIFTNKRESKPIEDVKVGDFVFSWDPKLQNPVTREFGQLVRGRVAETLVSAAWVDEIKWANGYLIKVHEDLEFEMKSALGLRTRLSALIGGARTRPFYFADRAFDRIPPTAGLISTIAGQALLNVNEYWFEKVEELLTRRLDPLDPDPDPFTNEERAQAERELRTEVSVYSLQVEKYTNYSIIASADEKVGVLVGSLRS